MYILTIFFQRDADFLRDGLKWEHFFTHLQLFGQFERCPDTNRIHIQAVYSPSGRRQAISYHQGRLTRAFASFGTPIAPIHFELCKRPSEATDYVCKDATRFSGPFGIKPVCDSTQPHGRSATTSGTSANHAGSDAIAAFSSGLTVAEFIRAHPNYAFRVSALTQLHAVLQPTTARPINRTCFWFWGPPGLGKTTLARCFPTPVAEATAGSPWVSASYNNPTTYVIDDPSQFKEQTPLFDHILIASDQFVKPQRILYGSTLLTHTIFILCTNCSPDAMLSALPQDRRIAFMRRFHFGVSFISRDHLERFIFVFDPTAQTVILNPHT